MAYILHTLECYTAMEMNSTVTHSSILTNRMLNKNEWHTKLHTQVFHITFKKKKKTHNLCDRTKRSRCLCATQTEKGKESALRGDHCSISWCIWWAERMFTLKMYWSVHFWCLHFSVCVLHFGKSIYLQKKKKRSPKFEKRWT